jgi:asparagine synthase (glutamine-hydrolysing)
MCGLAGAAGLIDQAAIDTVGAMNVAQKHRGPDAHGFYQSGRGEFGVALAHRRLAIIDLSPEANQPMQERRSGCVIVFNGEIYNYAELREELTKAGARFETQGDTEVILQAWVHWGPDAVKRFRGIFAFALWDPRVRQLHLVRDALGIKPLYWALRGKTVYFASELRALLDGGHPRRLDVEGVASFAWHGFVRGPGTIIAGVHLLPAATTLTLSTPGEVPRPQAWWTLPQAAPGTISQEQLAATLRDTVRMQLVSDVPLAVFLSGGIDSSAVAALACQAGGGQIHTFNVGFDEPALDESASAAKVAAQLGTAHQTLRIGAADFQRLLPDALASLDQPTFDAINTFVVSRAVRSAGITVALAGTGGDELFGGYKSFIDLPRGMRLPRPAALGMMAHLLVSATTRAALALGGVPPQTRWGKLADVLRADSLVALYQASYALFSSELYAELTKKLPTRWPHGLSTEQEALLSPLAHGATLHAISNLELSSFIGERLLRDTDAASMASSLEARVPLLDHVLIETVAGVTEAERFEPLGRKQALRTAALGNLDPALFERPKSGFVLPIETWCRQTLKDTLDATFADAPGFERVGLDPRAAAAVWHSFCARRPGIYWSRVWALFVLVDWCRRHRVSL